MLSSDPFRLSILALLLLLPLLPSRAQLPATRGVAFGRFGRVHDDGLLTVTVGPRGFTLPGLSVRWGDPQAPLSAIVPSIDPTEKKLAIEGGGDGAPTEIRYTLLYPGLAARFGNRMILRFQGADGRPVRCALDPSRLKADGLLLVPGDRFPAVPLLIVPPRRDDIRVWFNGASLRIEGSEPLGEIRFCTPTGIAPARSLDDAWRAARAISHLPVPTRLASTAALSADGGQVAVAERFSGGIAPVPPVLAWAIEKGYPARIEGDLVRTGALTRWGPFAYVRGAHARWTLPVPPDRARGYVRPAAPDPKRLAQLNALVAFSAGVSSAQLAFPLLDDAREDALRAAWRRELPAALALRPPLWKAETEPITGQSYLTGKGGATLYELAVYARYSGDWGLVRRNWDAARRIRRTYALADDWACLAAGDEPLSLVYAAAVGTRNLARGLGDRAEEEKAAIWAARTAVPTVARLWYTDYARATGQLGAQSRVIGYHETEGFVRCTPGKDDPWNATTLLSGGGGLPELMELYARTARPAVDELERAYEAAYPRWFEGGLGYPFATIHRGNSLFVTLPHIYARAVVLDEAVGRLWPKVDRALGNRDGGWIGPNVLAELVARESPLLLTGWGTARYVEGRTADDGMSATLSFVAPRAGPWTLDAELRSGVAVGAASLDDKPVAFTVTGRTLRITTPVRPGPLTLTVTFGPPAAAPTPTPPAPLTVHAAHDKVR